MSTIPKNDHLATVERGRVGNPPTEHKPSFSEDCTTTAYHEAGHAVAAHALGLQAVSTIWWDGKRPNGKRRCVLGATTHAPGTTRINEAIISWAGLVGEEVGLYWFLGFPDNIYEGFCEFTWHDYSSDPESMSVTDAEGIGHGKLSRKAFEQAVLIITGNLDKLHQYAGRLMRSLGRDGKRLGKPLESTCDTSCLPSGGPFRPTHQTKNKPLKHGH